MGSKGYTLSTHSFQRIQRELYRIVRWFSSASDFTNLQGKEKRSDYWRIKLETLNSFAQPNCTTHDEMASLVQFPFLCAVDLLYLATPCIQQNKAKKKGRCMYARHSKVEQSHRTKEVKVYKARLFVMGGAAVAASAAGCSYIFPGCH